MKINSLNFDKKTWMQVQNYGIFYNIMDVNSKKKKFF